MTRASPLLALLVLSAVIAACGLPGSATVNATPADLYAVVPSQADVRSLLGDSNWWAGPPSFGVRPLDAERMPATVKFSIGQQYVHIGSAEDLFVRYTLYDKSSSATTQMNDYGSLIPGAITSPKVGDQTVYVGEAGSGAAPYAYATYVRVGQIVMAVLWYRKDLGVKVNTLAKMARVFAGHLKDVGSTHSTVKQVDPKFLPPPGRDITPLGSAVVPAEAFVPMTLTPLAEEAIGLFHSAGITTMPYGDYVLNNDIHMEVQTILLTWPSTLDAAAFGKGIGGAPPDAQGIWSTYVPTSGSPAAGFYEYSFVQGPYWALLICKPSTDGEAATRDCEDPVHTTAFAWKSALGLAGA